MDQNQQDFLVSDIIAQNGIVAIHDLNYVTIHLYTSTPLHLSVDLLEADRVELEVFQNSDQSTALVVRWRFLRFCNNRVVCVTWCPAVSRSYYGWYQHQHFHKTEWNKQWGTRELGIESLKLKSFTRSCWPWLGTADWSLLIFRSNWGT